VNCSDFLAHMAAWVTGRLDAAERRAFEAHRDACARCAHELHRHTNVSCREIVEFLDAYVDGSLPPDRHAVFEEHVEACPPCVHYLDAYRATIAAGRSLSDAAGDVPAEMPDELVRAILAAQRAS